MKSAPLLLLLLLFAGCSKKETFDGPQCVKAKYVMEYCSAKPTSLVTFLEPVSFATSFRGERDTLIYQGALVELPAAFRKRDTVFYVTCRYDASLQKTYKAEICPAIFIPVRFLTMDGVSGEKCR